MRPRLGDDLVTDDQRAAPIDSVSEVLLIEIRKSDTSLRELARRSGVNHSVIAEFARRRRGLSLPSVNALAKALGLQLKKTRRKG